LPGRPHGGDRAFSACAFVGAKGRLTASARVQLLPAGEFRSLDGRPTEVSAWFIDGAIAATLIAAAAARETPYVLDYHHQSLLAAEQGLKAPAAGWFKTLEWVEGVGLFATDVQWTDAARQMVEADELRYVSPVFAWDRETGQVTHLINAALTNTPGLDGMTAVAERVAAALSGLVISTLESTMDDLIDRLRYFLNLPITATAEDCTAELQKLIEQIDTLPPPEFSAASLTLGGRLLAALSAAWGTRTRDAGPGAVRADGDVSGAAGRTVGRALGPGRWATRGPDAGGAGRWAHSAGHRDVLARPAAHDVVGLPRTGAADRRADRHAVRRAAAESPRGPDPLYPHGRLCRRCRATGAASARPGARQRPSLQLRAGAVRPAILT
jgi:hypothetical protein